MKEQNIQKKIQHLQSMLGEINRYLQGSASKPPGMISRLLDEKTRLTTQLRDLNNVYIGNTDETEGPAENISSIYSVAGKVEKGRESIHSKEHFIDPLEKRIDIDDILQEMGIKTEADEISKKILLSGADIFIDNLISTACTVARNKNQDELTKEEILYAVLMERKTELYNRSTLKPYRHPDKEHIRRMQMIKKDQKRYLGVDQ